VNPCAHHHPVDDLAAFAVDAIDDAAERRAIEGHLAHCPSCRVQLACHERALSSLIEDEAPPPAVWDGIVDRLNAPVRLAVLDRPPTITLPAAPAPDAGVLAPAPPAHARHALDAVWSLDEVRGRHAAPRGRHAARRGRYRRAGLVAAAAVAVVGLAVGALGTLEQVRDHGPADEQVAEGTTLGVLSSAGGDEMARVVEAGDGTFVVLKGVPRLPAGRAYQMWSLDGPEAVSLGMLGDGGEREVPVEIPQGTVRVAISDEPAGGSRAPSGLVAGSGSLRAA
jgi:anti-sigma-K factor RskA